MAEAYRPLPFGGGPITNEEFFAQRLSVEKAHDDPSCQTELAVIAADLDCFLEHLPVINELQGLRRFERKVEFEPWKIEQTASRFIGVRNSEKHLIYKLDCEHGIYDKKVYGRYFEIWRNQESVLSFTESTFWGDMSNALNQKCLQGVVKGARHPTLYDLQELEHAVLSLELLEIF